MAFYSEYGRAMGAWADVELAMYQVARQFFPDGMPRNMLGVGFAGIQGFRSKRLFVEAAVKRGLGGIKAPPITRNAWKELVARLDAKSGERNDLAHFVVFTFEKARPGRRFALCPHVTRKGTPHDQPPPGSYSLKKLIRVRREFDDLQIDLMNFLLHLYRAPPDKLLARSVQRPDHLPTTQQIADQMLEALGHPRVSAAEKKRRQDAENAAASLKVPLNLSADTTETKVTKVIPPDGGKK